MAVSAGKSFSDHLFAMNEEETLLKSAMKLNNLPGINK